MAQSDTLIKEMKRKVEKLVINMVLDIQGNLVRRTPVDTGWARNNWLPSVATAIESTAGTRNNIDTAKQSAGVAAVLRWRFEQGNAFISNNVPYISQLNSGTSKQAPAMFVETAIQAGIAKFARAKLK